MTVYNVNLGIGWASSGVEYAQSYRAQAFKKAGVDAKFIFSDLIVDNNIETYTANLGFDDDQIIWFYNYFTDIKIAPCSVKLADWVKDEQLEARHFVRQNTERKNIVTYISQDEGLQIDVRLTDPDKQTIIDVTYIANGLAIRREHYSYVKFITEYFNGDRQANVVAFREFYNEDGSIAYTDHLNGKDELFEFPDNLYYSKNELYLKMLKDLHMTADDTIIVDRMDDGGILINGQLIFAHHGDTPLVIVVHADHYDVHNTDKHNILWNNFYEYQFTHSKDVAAYIVATDKQREVLVKQQKKYRDAQPKVVTIPVGSLPELQKPEGERKPHSMITASRLADEKHIDWLIRATVKAHEQVPDISLDIYGYGGQMNVLADLIKTNYATNYIQLKGQHDLTHVYTKYAAYVAASTSEGFGLSLLEAVGSGLPMIGFDVPYGNPTFIDDGKNGHLLSYDEKWPVAKKVDELADAMVKLFTVDDQKSFSAHSYELAKPYLQENIAQRWQQLLEELHNA